MSILLLLRISYPHLVQAHTCKNGGHHYFKHLCPTVISSLNPLSEY